MAALLEAAEGGSRVEVVVRVDPHRPCRKQLWVSNGFILSRISDFKFRVLDSGIHISGCRFRAPGFRFQVSGFRLPAVSVLDLYYSSFCPRSRVSLSITIKSLIDCFQGWGRLITGSEAAGDAHRARHVRRDDPHSLSLSPSLLFPPLFYL